MLVTVAELLNLPLAAGQMIVARFMTPKDRYHIQAAQGWLELGNHLEAEAELEGVSTALKEHPDVLESRWGIGAKVRNWNACVEIGEALTRLAPERVVSWIHHAYALHELKRTEEAWLALEPARKRFPNEPTIPYNLACYACQLGRLAEARALLKQACAIGNASEWKSQALEDPDLAPLWVKKT